jgi:signal transduction histidine kinase/HAMP domain-containing protein
MRSEGKFIVGVLIASALVALVLAFQAFSAARSRQAVTDAMLRQYAELAATEFAREAQRSIDMSISRRLTAYVHPKTNNHCDCAPLTEVAAWFEVAPDGSILDRTGTMSPAMLTEIAAQAARDRNAEANNRVRFLASDPTRLMAIRAEPHASSGGGLIGLVTGRDVLVPMLSHTYDRATLLPPALVKGGEWRGLVDLHVEARDGRRVFSTEGTVAGPQVAVTELFADDAEGLRIRASMTPAYVAALGPEHTGGPSIALVVSLVLINVLLVTVGLWQLARERELVRLREDFVAGVSHELRTPLAQIRMFTETLLLDRVRSPQEGRRAIEIIGQETKRLGQLVENVLYFHRHRRAPLTAPGIAMNLSALVLEVVEGFKPLAASKRVRLASHIPAHEVIVVANADGIRQVLLNLLDNAVKFGPADSIVTVSLHTAGERARMTVEDQGAGVPPADRERIFEPFERGGARGAGGAGIGLAVVRQIVSEHQGQAFVEETGSGGARFVVELPLAPDESMAALAG